MKKVISLMLAAAMVFGLAACGSPKQPEQEAPVETENTRIGRDGGSGGGRSRGAQGAECGLHAQLCIHVGNYGRIGGRLF